MKKKMIIIGAVLAAFMMLMIPNISAVNEQVKEKTIKEETQIQSVLSVIKDKLGDGQYDWPILLLIVLAISFVIGIVVFVLSLALGKIGTALSNAIAAVVAFLQIVAAIFAGIGIFAGAAATILVWIDYLKGVQANL